MKKTIIFFQIMMSIVVAQAQSHSTARQELNKIDRLFFIENKGQWHKDVLYLCRMGGLDAWITKYGVNYNFYKIEKRENTTFSEKERIHNGKFEEELDGQTILGHRVLFEFQNNNSNPATESRQKQTAYYNYLIGNDPAKHASNVGLYKEVVVKDVYDGIDVRYYFDSGFLRFDFIAHPGADVSKIAFKLKGQYEEYLKENALCFTTRFGEAQMADLTLFQQNKSIEGQFHKDGNVWKINTGKYDPAQTLIIDPLLYSTYIGGSDHDYGWSIAIDTAGNAYVTGITYSPNYDTIPGAYQTTFGGGQNDAFVSKLNSTGTDLIYSTYLGGSSNDGGNSIAIDTVGNAYITGFTQSNDYNITPGVYQTTLEGGSDVFVSKLNNTGTTLIYSTYLGGSNNDAGYGIFVDAAGNAYITGSTESVNYDTTSGAYQTTKLFYSDVFVSKLNPTGTDLIYSTYLGGNNKDWGNDIAVDTVGNAYIIGVTESNDYNITSGVYQTTLEGGKDVFVSKLNSTGTALIYSTYLGGSDDDYGNSITIDTSGNAYIAGTTQSTDYDITSGAYQTACEGGGFYGSDIFVSKLNSTGTALIYSTYLGGSGDDSGLSIAIDASGNAYVTGNTISHDYDITPGAYQTIRIFYEAFVSKLNSTGTDLIYSTYLGGFEDDYGTSIAIDVSGNAYVTGYTLSSDYDTTSGAYQTTFGGYYDVFVTKLCLEAVKLTSASGTDNQAVCVNTAITNITYTTTGATGATFTGLPPGVTGMWSNDTITISGIPTVSGTFNYTVTLTGGCGNTIATGTIDVNVCTSIEENNVETSWSIHPNPNSGSFTIRSGKPSVFELTDITGKLIHTYRTQGNNLQVVENLPAGVYFVREKESGITQKIIIQ